MVGSLRWVSTCGIVAHRVPFGVCYWIFKVEVAKVPKRGPRPGGAAAATCASDSDSESAESAGIRVIMVPKAPSRAHWHWQLHPILNLEPRPEPVVAVLR